MAVTLSDNVTVVRVVQPENEEPPMLMLVLPAANVTVVRLMQPEKALSPMPVTLDGIVTSVILLQTEKAPPPMLRGFPVGNYRPARLSQLWNASAPMLVSSVAERSPVVSLPQPLTALSPMLASLAGNVTVVIFKQA